MHSLAIIAHHNSSYIIISVISICLCVHSLLLTKPSVERVFSHLFSVWKPTVLALIYVNWMRDESEVPAMRPKRAKRIWSMVWSVLKLKSSCKCSHHWQHSTGRLCQRLSTRSDIAHHSSLTDHWSPDPVLTSPSLCHKSVDRAQTGVRSFGDCIWR